MPRAVLRTSFAISSLMGLMAKSLQLANTKIGFRVPGFLQIASAARSSPASIAQSMAAENAALHHFEMRSRTKVRIAAAAKFDSTHRCQNSPK